MPDIEATEVQTELEAPEGTTEDEFDSSFDERTDAVQAEAEKAGEEQDKGDEETATEEGKEKAKTKAKETDEKKADESEKGEKPLTDSTPPEVPLEVQAAAAGKALLVEQEKAAKQNETLKATGKEQSQPDASTAGAASLPPPSDLLQQVSLTKEEKAFLEDYGEVGGISSKAAQAVLAKAVKDGVIPVMDHYKLVAKGMDIMTNEIISLHRTLNVLTVKAEIPDFKEINASKEFNDWLDGKSKEIKALHKSYKPADVITLINLFRKETDNPELKEKQEKAKQQKTKVDKLLSGTVSKSTGKRTGGGAAADDFDSGFGLAAKG